MYETSFGLTGKPFSLLPDADFMYPSRRHQRALKMLEYSISTSAGFVVITGEVGAGKTTLIRRYLKTANPDVCLGVITNSSASLGRLLHWIATAFSLEPTLDVIALHNQFINFLVAQYARGKRTVLIVDEAQNLTFEMLEELRMLSNVNNEKDQLLQIILVGQPELLETLRRPDLRQLVQRIEFHYHLEALSCVETAAYIWHRLSVVNGAAELFDAPACAAVYYFTGGVPRLINLLCDQALVYTYSEDEERVDYHTVMAVVEDRNSSGLSPFKSIPEKWDIRELAKEIEKGK